MNKAMIYIHGMGGSAAEAAHYERLLAGYDVIGFDYTAGTPWEAKAEFPAFFDGVAAEHESVSLIANSIGAYYTMCALGGKNIRAAYFISPIVDMEKLIFDMMARAEITDAGLKERGKIITPSGDVLSWDYLCYVRENPIAWSAPTHIIYGSGDALTPFETVNAFAQAHRASLTALEGGEHWFHTDDDMRFLDMWLMNLIRRNG